MTWSTAAPTAPGWYWYRHNSDGTPRVYHVGAWPAGGLAVRLPECSPHMDGMTTPEKCCGEWAGPLVPPD